MDCCDSDGESVSVNTYSNLRTVKNNITLHYIITEITFLEIPPWTKTTWLFVSILPTNILNYVHNKSYYFRFNGK